MREELERSLPSPSQRLRAASGAGTHARLGRAGGMRKRKGCSVDPAYTPGYPCGCARVAVSGRMARPWGLLRAAAFLTVSRCALEGGVQSMVSGRGRRAAGAHRGPGPSPRWSGSVLPLDRSGAEDSGDGVRGSREGPRGDFAWRGREDRLAAWTGFWLQGPEVGTGRDF